VILPETITVFFIAPLSWSFGLSNPGPRTTAHASCALPNPYKPDGFLFTHHPAPPAALKEGAGKTSISSSSLLAHCEGVFPLNMPQPSAPWYP